MDRDRNGSMAVAAEATSSGATSIAARTFLEKRERDTLGSTIDGHQNIPMFRSCQSFLNCAAQDLHCITHFVHKYLGMLPP
ncbi:uncharacterized protein LOC125500004 isoform X6 [Athalia rosae]|uniref:uncharacterized protein LOC125500004 isoform X6 n=1 Tax=Athalia rosae TaxID=37344 RepID=UPI00203497FB|nr:uncharacterized protein LOC125500004 isoform X6 [Athalia rosae]